jgi:nucleophosmin 1
MNLQNVAVTNAKESVNLFACTDAISGDKVKALLAVLSSKIPQAQLNLVFGYDVPVAFRVEGCSKAEVHISGYYQPVGDDSDSDDDSDDDSEGDDFDEEAYMNSLKNADGSLTEEGKMLVADDMSGSEDSQESDSEDERVDADFIKKMIAQSGGANGDSESDSEEESEEEEEEEAPPPKKQKAVVTPSGKGSSKSKQKSAQKTPNSSQKNHNKMKSGEKRKR